ncbi:MAG: hypothetical protein ABJB40_11245 [Acidobacteriota bacterium]
MYQQISKKLVFITIFIFGLTGLFAQEKDKKGDMSGTPVMWEKVDTPSLDLYLGPGGEALKPDLSTITFVSEEKGGHSQKYKIKDGAGHTWVAKIGDESQSETAAVRLVWALGYKSEINYLVPTLTIPGKGTFNNVRLEARGDGIKRLETWSWKDNPFKGHKEFQGLKIMMAFLNNWDMKEANNVVLKNGDQLQYVISDLGVSFGKTGGNGLPLFWRIGRSRNVPEQYVESDFVKDVKNGKIKFEFNGKNMPLLNDVTKSDGRWLADLLVQLTDKQIEDAFRAANYSEADVATLTKGVKDRIRALDLATQDSVAVN